MPESVFAEKRTRSQVTLPDDILKLPQQSPLKNARIVQKSYATDVSASNPSEDTDDELLLSPRKEAGTEDRQEPRSKRSVSPPGEDEYLRRSQSPSAGRELKRARHGVSPVIGPNSTDITNVQHALPRRLLTHSRNHSDPVVTVSKRVTRKHFAAASIKPSSFSTATPPPPSSPIAKGRAQSVPIFSSSYPILHVDLANPPSSPRRTRSRSPSKEPELKYRIISGLKPGGILTPILDETQGMDVDEDGVALIAPPATDLSSLNSDLADATPPLQSESSLSPSTQTVPAPPRTPTTLKSTLLLQPLSPLTPLPETPYPSKLMMGADDRYIESGWLFGSSLQGEHSKEPNAHRPHETATTPATSQSGIPKFGIRIPGKATTSKMPPPPGVPVGKVIKPIASSSQSTSASNRVNAFDVMMGKTSDGAPNNDKGKGKAKRTTTTLKPGPSVLPKVKGSMLKTKSDKGMNEEAKLSKATLKAKMRARPQQKTKRLPEPTTFVPNGEEFEVEETDDDPPVKSPWRRQRAPSPVPDNPAPPVTTPPVLGLPGPQETIKPDLPEGNHVVYNATNTESSTDEPSMSSVIAIGHNPAPSTLEISTTGLETYNPERYLKDSKTTQPVLDVPLSEPEPEPPAPAGVNKSRLPLGKKRAPLTLPPRVTRSASLKMKGADEVSSTVGSRKGNKKFTMPPPPPPTSSKWTASGSIKSKPSTDSDASTSSLSDLPTDPADEIQLVPGSPMTLASPVRSPMEARERRSFASSSFAKMDLSKTPSKSRIPTKLGTPSPNKIARSASMFVTRHTNIGDGGRLFLVDSATAGGSSLSTLANALEKLKMPAPSRPNTSMGFNREIDDDNDQSVEVPKRSKDDGAVGMEGLGTGSLKRSATVSSMDFDHGSLKAAQETPETSKSVNGKQQSLVQKPVSMFFHKLQAGSGHVMRGRPKIFGVGSGSGIFGSGARRPLAKASRKTSLPSVMASPAKGDNETSPIDEPHESMDGGAIGQSDANLHDVFMESAQTEITDILTLADLDGDNVDKKGKGKEREQVISPRQSPRRASLANALSRSTSSIPQPKGRGLMGPPATPPSTRIGMRSSSSTLPESISSPGRLSSGPTTRMGSRSAPSALSKIKGGTNGHVSSGRKATNEPSEAMSSKTPADSKILKDCVIFVDVKTDDGDEAGSLFVERLEEMGAKILSRVGQTCTQIVYKNGMASTLNRYRQLRDPKPLIVGIAWVVECVEQGQHLDETKFLVDLDEITTTNNKRRRSMLPKLISRTVSEASISDVEHEDGDRSMDGSVNLDDDLTPLEKARRRRSMLVGLKS